MGKDMSQRNSLFVSVSNRRKEIGQPGIHTIYQSLVKKQSHGKTSDRFGY
jgi:hypothetical protein